MHYFVVGRIEYILSCNLRPNFKGSKSSKHRMCVCSWEGGEGGYLDGLQGGAGISSRSAPSSTLIIVQAGSIASNAVTQAEQCTESALALFECTDGWISISAMRIWVERVRGPYLGTAYSYETQ
jgi:hypothetical protein